MAQDPLHEPLKPRGWRERLRLRPSPALVAFAVVLVALASLGVWAWMQPPPKPQVAVAERELPPQPMKPAPAPQAADLATEPLPPTPGPEEPGRMKGRKAQDGLTGGKPRPKILDVSKLPDEPYEEGGAEAGKVVIDMPGAVAALPKAPARDLVERTPLGPLPKVGRKGRVPWKVYARPVPRAVLRSSRPKVAVLVVDLGLRAGITDEAIRKLPPEVSLAFAPKGGKVRRLGLLARRHGHEFFLQVPMEPWGYPRVNPGPDTLLSGAGAAQNRQRLHRVMARAVGYVGLVSYAGQKFLQAGEALPPVLHELKRRGLMMVDDGTAVRSLLPELGLVVQLPVLRADVRLPPGLKEPEVRAMLLSARDLAAERGQALVVISASETNLNLLRDWLAGLTIDEQGPVLVPVTALARLRPGN